MIIQGQVGPTPNASLGDGIQPILLAGRSGEAIAASLHGKFFTQAYRGNVFTGSTAAAGVVPAAIIGTAPTFVIWNPFGSGKNIVPIRITMGVVSVSSSTAGAFGLGYKTGVGAQAATGGPVTAITLGTPINMNLGSGAASVSLFSPSSATLAANGAALPGVHFSSGSAAVSAFNEQMLNVDLDGMLVVSPGTLIYVGATTAAGITAQITAIWEEVPV